jgi:branched-subunit amino acid transport protein
VTTSYGPVAVWLAVVGAGVLTYALRLSFILLFGRIDTVPPRLVGVLRYVPAAVLAALVAPAIVSLSAAPTLGLQYELPKLLAGGVALVVAWRRESVLATIGAGMGSLWLFQALL